jgi:transcriptional regulator with XRE-family HTH domain
MDTEQGKILGAFIRVQREERGMSGRQLAAAVSIDIAQIVRLEQGTVASPKADLLSRIAEVLDLPLADLYSLAGYTIPRDLPSFRPYLRAKYGTELPDAAMAEMERYFARLAKKHGTSGPLDGEDEQ